MASTGQGLMRLKDVTVHLKGSQPQTRLKLKLTIDGRSEIRTFKKGASLYWESDITCTLHPRIEFSLAKHHRFLRWRNKRLAYIENAALTPDEEGRAMIYDPTGTLSVILSFANRSAKDIEEDVREGRDIIAGKKVLFDKLGMTRSFVEGIVKAADVVGDIHPSAKAALGALGLLIDACKEQEACRNAVEELSEDLELIVNIYGRLPELTAEKKPREAQRALMLLIANISTYIRKHTKTGAFSDLVTSSYRENIETFRSQLRKLQKRLDGEVQGEILSLVADTAENTSLNILQPVGTYWESGQGCLSGTRTKLLQVISNWVHGIESSDQKMDKEQTDIQPPNNIFWLYGLAGSGKSTVAHTVAKNFTLDGLYVTCYFCARDGSDGTPPNKVIPTIAHQLAQLYLPYRKALVNQLSGATSYPASNKDIGDQRQYLFQDLFASGDMVPFRPVVIVIDGLDNCGRDNHSQRTLALDLRELAIALPWLRLVVTSRDRPDICAAFAGRCYAMDIGSAEDIHGDIRLYVDSRIKHSVALSNGPGVSDADIERLVTRADGLFEWCSTVFRFLEGCVYPLQDLKTLLAGQGATDVLHNLYTLYGEVLALRFPHQRDVAALRDILGIIFISSTTQPLSSGSIAHFLPSQQCAAVLQTIQLLSPVLYCTDAGLVQAYHLSFLDFVKLQLNTAGWPDETMLHRAMAISCLNTLHKELRFNICELHDSSLLNDDVPDLANRISSHIPAELQYSSLFWMTHVALSPASLPTTPSSPTIVSEPATDDEFPELVRGLICHHRVLFWLEILTLMGRIERGIDSLLRCLQRFAGSSVIRPVANDVRRFVEAYGPAMASTPHLYISALSWLPIRSQLLSGSVLPEQVPLPLVAEGRPEDWSPYVWTQQLGDDSSIMVVKHLPHTHQILALSHRQAFLLDAYTGLLLWSFFAHEDSGRAEDYFNHLHTAVSPDGTLIAVTGNILEGGDTDRTPICIRGSQSREIECGRVLSLTFAADGKHLITATRSENEEEDFVEVMVCAWDTAQWCSAIRARIRPENDAKDLWPRAELSPNGEYVIITCSDERRCCWFLELWEVDAAASTRPNLRVGQITTSLWFPRPSWSSDGQSWLWSNDERTDVWHVGSDGHWQRLFTVPIAQPVHASAWSPDSKQLALACATDVKIVEIPTGSIICTYHIPEVASLSYSNDGGKVAWAGQINWFGPGGELDGTWADDRLPQCGLLDIALRKYVITRPYSLDPDTVPQADMSCHSWSCAFNSDGTQVIHASRKGTIQLEDVAPLWTKLEGFSCGDAPPPLAASDYVAAFRNSRPKIIACSPNGRRLVLSNGTVLATEAAQPVASGELWEDTIDPSVVAYFPDGRYIAAAFGADIAIVDTHSTVNPVQCTLIGHTAPVLCLSVSSDGTRVASGSRDQTARVWTVQLGDEGRAATPQEIVKLVDEHAIGVYSAILAPDCKKLVSVTYGVRIWDLDKRLVLKECRGRGAAYSPKGTYITIFGSLSITLFDAGTLEELHHIQVEGPILYSYFEFQCQVTQTAFSCDETRIAVGFTDLWRPQFFLYSVADGGQLEKLNDIAFEAYTPFLSTEDIVSMTFSPDDRYMVVRTEHGVANLFHEPTLALWHDHCSKMTLTSGWIKDPDGRLLLWIPSEYRKGIQQNQRIYLNTDALIVRGPLIDAELVFKVGGEGWAEHFAPFFR